MLLCGGVDVRKRTDYVSDSGRSCNLCPVCVYLPLKTHDYNNSSNIYVYPPSVLDNAGKPL